MSRPIDISEAVRLANQANNSNTMYSSEKVVVYENAIQILLDAVDRLEDFKKAEMAKALPIVQRRMTEPRK